MAAAQENAPRLRKLLQMIALGLQQLAQLVADRESRRQPNRRLENPFPAQLAIFLVREGKAGDGSGHARGARPYRTRFRNRVPLASRYMLRVAAAGAASR